MGFRDTTGQQMEEHEEGSYRILLVACLFLMTLMVFGSFHSFGVFLKPLADRFGATRAAVSGAISVAWLMHGISGMLSGMASDRWGPKPIMATGSFIIAAAYMLMATSGSLWHLYLFVGVMLGAGIGPFWVVSSAITAQWFSRHRGLSLGIVMAGPGAGHFVIPPLCQYLITHFGLHTTYFILGLLILVTVFPLSFLLRPAPTMRNTREIRSAMSEQQSESNITVRNAMGTRSFWFLFGIWLLVPLSIQLIRVHIFPYASDQGIDESAASLMFLFMGAGIMAGRIGWGSIADRFGSKRTFAVVLALIAMAQFSAIGANTLGAFYALAMVYGFVMGGNDPVYVKLVTEFFGPRHGGALLGIFGFAYTTSSSVGPFFAGLIYDRTESYSWAFFLSGVVVLIALLLVQGTKKPRI
jgi:MFS family permease